MGFIRKKPEKPRPQLDSDRSTGHVALVVGIDLVSARQAEWGSAETICPRRRLTDAAVAVAPDFATLFTADATIRIRLERRAMDEPFAPPDAPPDEIVDLLVKAQELHQQEVEQILARARGEFRARSIARAAASSASAPPATPSRTPKPPDDAA